MKQQILQKIMNNMELFKKQGSSCGCGLRSYLVAAARLNEYEKEISGIASDNLEELEEISCNIEHILKNLGICEFTKKEDSGE